MVNPSRIVVVPRPDERAACGKASGRAVREFCRQSPGPRHVSYINTSIEVKAESDISGTSRTP